MQKGLSARSHGDITDGKLTGQKLALTVKAVWSIRARLELSERWNRHLQRDRG